MTALADVTGVDAAIVYSLEPLWGVAFAWWFLGERLEAQGWAGAGLIMVASLWTQVMKRLGRSPNNTKFRATGGGFTATGVIIILNMLLPVNLNSITHVRVLLVLTDRGILA
jgi:hypothetical protein